MEPIHIVGSLLGLLALAVILIALFGDRARGRSRCPRCWYDMEGLSGCPECGWSGRAGRMVKTRRRWKLACLGLLCGLLSGGALLTPHVAEHGWASIAPTTLLLYLVPSANDEIDPATGELRPIPGELKRRNAFRSMSDWQWRMYIERSGMFELRARPDRGECELIIHIPNWVPDFISICCVDDSGNSFADDAMYMYLPESDPQWVRWPDNKGRPMQLRKPVELEFSPDISYVGRSPARKGLVDIRIDLWGDWGDADPLGHKGTLWQGKINIVIPDFRPEI